MKPKTKLRFPITIRWSDEDRSFIAEVPDLRGCISHGRSYVQTAERITEAMRAILAVKEKHGDPIPDPVVSCSDGRA